MVVEGLSVEDFLRWKLTNEKFSLQVASLFPAQLEFISPAVYNGTVADDLSILPLSANQKEKLKAKYGNIELALNHSGGQGQPGGWSKGDYFKVLRSVFPMAEAKIVEKEREKVREEKLRKKTEEECIEKGEIIPLKHRLLLSISQMIEENYPIPMKGHMSEKYSKYVLTSKDGYLPLTKDSPLYSVDCEMCLTSIGRNELTRVCVVDSNLKVVYHR